MPESVVQLERVTKVFGKHVAVDNLDLQIDPGVICGLIGPNGSGKTTTLRMILRIIHPDQGRIVVLGCDSGRTSMDRIGYLPEERGLYKKMRVRSVLRFFAELKGRRSLREIDEWLERFDLTAWANKRVEALSKGMSQKVQFIATIVAHPSLLILDEPFSGLDPVNRDVIRESVLRLRAEGTSVLLSTHDMAVAEQMCDTICMLFRGKKVLDGPLAAIQAQYGDDTIRVRAEGNGDCFTGLPGVVRVSDLGRYRELRLSTGVDPQSVLQELLRRTAVQQFELTRPTLHDIFVRIAGPGADQEETAQHA
jgi:ABC-2 type transport system ATP-binding protein